MPPIFKTHPRPRRKEPWSTYGQASHLLCDSSLIEPIELLLRSINRVPTCYVITYD